MNPWNFDTERIVSHGDYQRIVERMAEMAQGSPPLVNIQDYADLETEDAWFAFSFKGWQMNVECTVEDDWADMNIFSKFVELLAVADPSKNFIHFDLGGQDCHIGCVKKDDLKKLNTHGIKFVPLT